MGFLLFKDFGEKKRYIKSIYLICNLWGYCYNEGRLVFNYMDMAEKKYYTSEEMDKVMYSYIRETANDLKLELSEKIKIDNNKHMYV